MAEHLSKHVPIRFDPSMVTAAKRLASVEGKTASAWIRSLVEREIARRDGKCPTCGSDFGVSQEAS